MNKIVMLFWVLTDAGQVSQPERIEGWRSMDECETAAESLVVSNPQMKATFKYNVAAMCIEVPR